MVRQAVTYTGTIRRCTRTITRTHRSIFPSKIAKICVTSFMDDPLWTTLPTRQTILLEEMETNIFGFSEFVGEKSSKSGRRLQSS